MRSSTFKKFVSKGIEEHGAWLSGVPAIVADNQDPERSHRVRVIIPSIDPNEIFDEWARQMVFCLGKGFGSAMIPPKGSEVVLFGQLGQKYNLFYGSLYNEEMTVPDSYDDENVAGIHAPGELKFIAETLARLVGQNAHVVAQQLAKITGQNVESIATTLNKITGQELRLEGVTIKLNGSGDIEISGGNVKITGSSIKLHNRTVNTSGPPI